MFSLLICRGVFPLGGGRLLADETSYINILHKLMRLFLREPFISHNHPEFLLLHIPAHPHHSSANNKRNRRRRRVTLSLL